MSGKGIPTPSALNPVQCHLLQIIIGKHSSRLFIHSIGTRLAYYCPLAVTPHLPPTPLMGPNSGHRIPVCSLSLKDHPPETLSLSLSHAKASQRDTEPVTRIWTFDVRRNRKRMAKTPSGSAFFSNERVKIVHLIKITLFPPPSPPPLA